MSLGNTERQFGPVARALHWLSALLVVAAIGLIESHDFFEKGSSARSLTAILHMQAGALVLVLTLPRLFWRFTQVLPSITPPPPAWQNGLAHAMHFVFYALLLALPLSGIAMRQAHGDVVTLLGVSLPALIAPNDDLHETLESLHELMGNAMILLVLAHVAAAVVHHRIQRDDTLTRMLPPRR
ncbi:cytochrome b [Niveibacterium umoris]|uniref:Cytochrome b561 n=1 Tax=Niveibacterium umoris TaxID=1193620 RepID=A0A840BPQ3_9RHOO|nr:cytochrome b [Niveibacterium umoris]MBB4013508.1 cytochrome b561 [Niveibacterium umoris]